MTQTPVCRKGQALVEFALVIAILLLVVIGGLRIGLVISNSLAMNNVADEGVFRISLGESTSTAEAFMREQLRDKAVNPDEITIVTACSPSPCAYGSIATVLMTKTVSIDAILWQASFPISAQAGAIIQKEQ